MKSTGIVRRIDDLGRVVIPKEIRRQMRIRESDPLELFIDGNDTVCFKRYDPMQEVDIDTAAKLVESVLYDGFALFDRYGVFLKGSLSVHAVCIDEIRDSDAFNIIELRPRGERDGYLVLSKEHDEEKALIAQKVLSVFLDSQLV